jgi:hypothetical protein
VAETLSRGLAAEEGTSPSFLSPRRRQLAHPEFRRTPSFGAAPAAVFPPFP